jgi:hypothetical protein
MNGSHRSLVSRLFDHPTAVSVLVEYMEILQAGCELAIEKDEDLVLKNPWVVRLVAQETRKKLLECI